MKQKDTLQNELQELDHKICNSNALNRRSWKNVKVLKKNTNIYTK